MVDELKEGTDAGTENIVPANDGVNQTQASDIPAAAAAPKEEVDERGVPLRNVKAEFQRKFESQEQKLERQARELEMLKEAIARQQYVAPQPPKQAQEQVAVDSFDEDTRTRLDAYLQPKLEQLVAERTRKQSEQLALEYIRSISKDEFEYNSKIKQIVSFANENGINLSGDFYGRTKAVVSLMDKLSGRARSEAQAAEDARRKAEEDKIRTEEIARKQLAGGNTPVPQVRNDTKKTELFERMGRGDQKAMEEYISQLNPFNPAEHGL